MQNFNGKESLVNWNTDVEYEELYSINKPHSTRENSHNETIDQIIENRSNDTQLKLTLSQEQICIKNRSTGNSDGKKKNILKSTMILYPIDSDDFQEIKINDIKSDQTVADFFIPQIERKSLLRKYSVPMIDAKRLIECEGAVAKSPSLQESYGQSIRNFDPKSNLDDQYKCSICKNVFSEPRILDCLHSFCVKCLVNLDTATASTSVVSMKYGEPGDTELVGSLRIPRSGTGLTRKSSDSMLPHSHSEASSIETVVPPHRIRSDSRSSVTMIPARKIGVKNKEGKNSIKSKVNKKSPALSFNEHMKIIKCPICGYATYMPLGGINRLPYNFVLAQKVQKLLRNIGSELNSTVWCSLCCDEVVV